MMQETELQALIKEVLQNKLPDWKATYYANICTNIQVHTKGLLFSKVDTLFPHEHPGSKKHCLETYEPITKGSIGKGLNNINRIFCNSGFSVSASDKTLKAINENNYHGKNFFTWFVPQWIDVNLASDPNSLCAIYPDEYLTKHPGEKIRFIESAHRLMHRKNKVAFVSLDESEKEYSVEDTVVKSEVFLDPEIKSINSKRVVEKTYNQRVVAKITRAVYHVFTDEYMLRFMEDGKEGTYIYELIQFKKKRNIPVFKLTSKELQKGVQESFLAPFIPFGNLALLQHRNHRAVDLMFSYPRMSEVQSPCDNLSCHEGTVTGIDGKASSCSRCGGTGAITVQSPYKTYLKKVDTGLTDPEAIKAMLSVPPVSFHTPDTAILEYSKESWKDYLAMAEEAIFVQQKQTTGNVESFKAKEIDKEGEYTFTQSIGKALNTDLRSSIQILEDEYNANPSEVTVELPVSLAIVSELEAFEALAIIIGSEAPVFVKAQQVENYLHKYVSKNSPVIKAINVLKRIDKMLFYSQKDVQSFRMGGILDDETYSIHVFAYSVLMQMYEQDKQLFQEEEQTIAARVLEGIPKKQPGELKQALMGKV